METNTQSAYDIEMQKRTADEKFYTEFSNAMELTEKIQTPEEKNAYRQLQAICKDTELVKYHLETAKGNPFVALAYANGYTGLYEMMEGDIAQEAEMKEILRQLNLSEEDKKDEAKMKKLVEIIKKELQAKGE